MKIFYSAFCMLVFLFGMQSSTMLGAATVVAVKPGFISKYVNAIVQARFARYQDYCACCSCCACYESCCSCPSCCQYSQLRWCDMCLGCKAVCSSSLGDAKMHAAMTCNAACEKGMAPCYYCGAKSAACCRVYCIGGEGWRSQAQEACSPCCCLCCVTKQERERAKNKQHEAAKVNDFHSRTGVQHGVGHTSQAAVAAIAQAQGASAPGSRVQEHQGTFNELGEDLDVHVGAAVATPAAAGVYAMQGADTNATSNGAGSIHAPVSRPSNVLNRHDRVSSRIIGVHGRVLPLSPDPTHSAKPKVTHAEVLSAAPVDPTLTTAFTGPAVRSRRAHTYSSGAVSGVTGTSTAASVASPTGSALPDVSALNPTTVSGSPTTTD
ncbi:MAG TPA: hypothetical protein VLG71_00305, partial [Candidatus Limnocylindria bacterium]|nr:hypothetical protein [Candidatus Limnocylindria bacterium]